MRRRNCFWLNQKVSDNSGYDTEVLYGPIELWIMFEIFFFKKSSKIAKEKSCQTLLPARLQVADWGLNLSQFSFISFISSFRGFIFNKKRDHIASVKHYFNRICFVISFNDFLMLDYLHLSLIVKDCRLVMTLLYCIHIANNPKIHCWGFKSGNTNIELIINNVFLFNKINKVLLGVKYYLLRLVSPPFIQLLLLNSFYVHSIG